MPSPREIGIVLGVTCAGTAVATAALLLYQWAKQRRHGPLGHQYSDAEFLELQRRIDRLEQNIQYLQERLESRILPTLKSSASVTTSAEEDFQEALEYFTSEESAGKDPRNYLFEQADTLLESKADKDKAQAYRLFEDNQHKFPNDFEFLWRSAKATYLYSQTMPNDATAQEQKKSLCYKAKDYAFQALALNEDDANVQKWCALTVGTICDFVGTKERIQYGYEFKVHIDEALRLNPSDFVCHHLLGRWCFGVASLTWIERKVASALFGEPPISTYEAALKEFLLAEEGQDEGWAENELFLAKCHLALGDKSSAQIWLENATKSPQSSSDDKVAAGEAAKLLGSL